MTRTAFLVLMLCLIATACGDNEPTARTVERIRGPMERDRARSPLMVPGQSPHDTEPAAFVHGLSRSEHQRISYNFSGCWSKNLSESEHSHRSLLSPAGTTRLGLCPQPRMGETAQKYGWFTSDRTASGTALFFEIPCGPGGGNWTATKQ